MFKRDKPIISFVSTVPGLENIEEARPRPAKEFIPSWWHHMPKIDPVAEGATVRSCPAMNDYFSAGYIMPMWADTTIKYSKEKDEWSVYSGRHGGLFEWSVHYNYQALNHTSFKTFGQAASFIFKAICPWKIVTRNGW